MSGQPFGRLLAGLAATSGENRQGEITCLDDYSTIWRTAFALAHNVRFTRTPDVELMRKRAATDLAYTRRLWLQQRKKHGRCMRHLIRHLRSRIISAERETMPVSTAEFFHSLHEEQITADEKASETVADLKKTGAVLISDSAFFECVPFDLDDIAETVGQQNEAVDADESAQDNVTVPQPQQDTLIQLYRVVECRQTVFAGAAAPTEEVQDMAVPVAEEKPCGTEHRPACG